MLPIEQGDILKIENIAAPILVASKNFFNQGKQIIGCPVVADGEAGPLHIPVSGTRVRGVVLCEQMKFLDLRFRGYQRIEQIPYPDRRNIADAIQGIFDYF